MPLRRFSRKGKKLTPRLRGLHLAAPALLGACGLISFEKLRVATFPGERNQLIAATDAVQVQFSIPPDKAAAERLLKILSDKGTQSGDLAWTGGRLIFTPAPPLQPNVRYLLSFSGELPMADGRSFTVDVEVPFFVGSASPPPRLTGWQPADGASCGVHTPLQLVFSDPIDADSFQQGFTLNPGADFQISWSADGTAAAVAPRRQWTNLALYTWEVGEEIRSASGAPLATPRSGSFRVQEDSTAPELLSTQPAVFQENRFLPLEGTLDELRARDCILIRFSEAVRLETLQTAFRLEPSIRGHFVQAGLAEFAFVPEQNYALAVTHHLAVSTDLEDLAGNRMAVEYHEWFVPAIPVLEVRTITPFGGPPVTAFNCPDPVPVSLAPGGELKLTIEFSVGFAGASLAEAPLRLTCRNYFPESYLQPELRQATWPNPSTLEVIFTGLAEAAPPARRYYLLRLPGGESGIGNEEGSYLKEAVWVLFVQ